MRRLRSLSRRREGARGRHHAIEGELIQTAARNSNDALRHPARLNLRLASLVSILSSADAAPPRQAFEVYDTDVAAFNALVRQAGLPAVAWAWLTPAATSA